MSLRGHIIWTWAHSDHHTEGIPMLKTFWQNVYMIIKIYNWGWWSWSCPCPWHGPHGCIQPSNPFPQFQELFILPLGRNKTFNNAVSLTLGASWNVTMEPISFLVTIPVWSGLRIRVRQPQISHLCFIIY